MKFLFVASQKKNVDSFRSTLARLLDNGHRVRLALQGGEAEHHARVVQGLDGDRLTLDAAPTARGDDWRVQAPLVRRIRDWVQYLAPEYTGADTLRVRVLDRLRAELSVRAPALGDGLVRGLPPAQVDRLRLLLDRIEAAIPSDPLHDELIRRDRPDVVLVTPGVHFGSSQADVIKSARAAGIPAWMLLFSWDNLSTKGALHVQPDLMFVWNERQRTEAATLHHYPPNRVIPVGAPRFDDFFALAPVLSRRRFLSPLGLPPDAPVLLYLCSSRFVAPRELAFIHRWLAAVRASDDPALRSCSVIVRPHPDIPLLEDGAPEVVRWFELPGAEGWVNRPFSDSRAVVLRTTYAVPQAFFECLHHSAAVVGLNTSAELEAAIAGRPVFTVLAGDESVTGQVNTLHFHYLLREHGGIVVTAPDMATHMGHLATALASQPDASAIQRFAREFLRPRGDRPAAAVLADELLARAHPAIEEARDAVRLPAGPRPHEETATLVRTTAPQELGAPTEAPARLLRVGYPGSSLRVRATPETRKKRSRGELVLDPDTVEWIDGHIHPTDVYFDVGAGIGEYALIAATHRNAFAFAFEPGFASYKRLCEHVLLNDCRQSIVPLPLAVGDRTGLLELEYAGAAGEDRHRLRARTWWRRPYDAASRYVQPVCASRLDDIVAQYGLPRPTHIRIHVPRGADAVVRGALQTLTDPNLKSVLVVAPRAEIRPAVEALLLSAGLSLVPPPPRFEQMQRLVFLRDGARVHATPAGATRNGMR